MPRQKTSAMAEKSSDFCVQEDIVGSLKWSLPGNALENWLTFKMPTHLTPGQDPDDQHPAKQSLEFYLASSIVIRIFSPLTHIQSCFPWVYINKQTYVLHGRHCKLPSTHFVHLCKPQITTSYIPSHTNSTGLSLNLPSPLNHLLSPPKKPTNRNNPLNPRSNPKRPTHARRTPLQPPTNNPPSNE